MVLLRVTLVSCLAELLSCLCLQEDAIREFWEECGAVEDLDLMRFPDTGRFKGIAFITFATVSCAGALSTACLGTRSCCRQAVQRPPVGGDVPSELVLDWGAVL